ncbi:MAG: DNA polymerase III subunit gamma/tau [Porticoccaceae bacterium]|jgi:DNA polymerase-3 subunit gamma/tau|nr:DNA polymerase III subunit gamma/tau [Porticoccaceae bacterium]HLS98432.1 DNA polymerase III subunit gamma/tau [Porticoccaceae bacterium]
MSYQVLARKWRPRTFDEMVGQEHVLKALVNGLDNGRLHHAYLFTGTRGVGKTTLARIIAKCLNCERGVSSTPCGECGACRAIAEGRFVDLLEVDAASRTKVEDTREMLDNVQYLPTSGRYKVYLIDEVHMLSTHSFNALLKTLEEPPPHVKFLLATTDPQKLPVTILSRCLQFNLKNLGPERIVGHLKHVLGEEKVPFEEEALWALGRAADGSMRDALSLTDQAIAHGGGQVTQAEVAAMLGTIDRGAVVDICEAVARGDAAQALALVQRLADHAPDYGEALAEMLSFWHRVAIAQTAPDALDQSHGDHHRVLQLAAQLSREDVQLYYQIALLGRRDLPFAADPRSGFEMVLLRLLAFQPQLPDGVMDEPPPRRAPADPQAPAPSPAPPRPRSEAPRPEATAPVVASPVEPAPAGQGGGPRLSLVKPARVEAPPVGDQEPDGDRPPWEEYDETAAVSPPAPVREQKPTPARTERAQAAVALASPPDVAPAAPAPASDTAPDIAPAMPRGARPAPLALAELRPGNWIDVYLGLEVGGLLQNIAANLELVAVEGSQLRFNLDSGNSTLYKDDHQGRLAEVLGDYLGQPVQVAIDVGPVIHETPWMILQRRRAERLAEAVASLRQDPHVRALESLLGGELVDASVKPID